MKSFIPHNLDIDKLLNEKPPRFKNPDRDELTFIISTIIFLHANKKDTRFSEFVPLHAASLRKKVYRYNHYLRYLCEEGIIECDNHYIPKEKSRGYRIAPSYRTKVVECDLSNSKLIWSVQNDFNSQLNTPELQHVKHLYRFFNEKLQIDKVEAIKYLEESFLNRSPQDIEKYNANYRQVVRIESECFSFHVDSNVNRLHTNLTNLKSELRNLITYNKKTLVSIDIKNSQPFLSTLLLNESFYDLSKNEKMFNLSSIDNRLRNYNDIIKDIIMILKPKETPDIQQYKSDVQNGILYEKVLKELRTITTINYPEDRSIGKEIIFYGLFGSNQSNGLKAIDAKDVLMSLYPNVYRCFRLIKKKDHNELALILQRIESELIIKRITKRISNEKRNLPIFTIHDSIVCTKGHEMYVEQVIRQEFIKATGLSPSLKIEEWDPRNLKA